MKWQHVQPQREQDHEIVPIKVVKSTDPKRTSTIICKECLARIKQVPDNEGPEGLKAFFPL